MTSLQTKIDDYKAECAKQRGVTPSKFDADLFRALLRWIENGKTLATFCVEHSIGRRTIYDWLERDEEPARQVTHARQLGCLAIEDELREIADRRDRSDPDDVKHRRLQIYAREKVLAWHDPERYGQKQQIQQTVQHKVVLSDTERAVRIKQLLDKAARKKPQLEIEVHEDEPSDAER